MSEQSKIAKELGLGCTDHSCIWGHTGGMGTNGGCHCLVDDDRPTLRRAARGVRALAARVAYLEQENARLTSDLIRREGELEAESRRER